MNENEIGKQRSYFNPTIVLLQLILLVVVIVLLQIFQSYNSLITTDQQQYKHMCLYQYFNPTIVLLQQI